MNKPFYLRCECGEKFEHFFTRKDRSTWLCRPCERMLLPSEIAERYATALGVAVEALEEITTSSDCDYGHLAEKALKKIRGEK